MITETRKHIFRCRSSCRRHCARFCSLTLPFVGERENIFNSNLAELLLVSAPTCSRIFISEVQGFYSGESSSGTIQT